MAAREEDVREMAKLAGIALSYRDAFGHLVETPLSAVLGLLDALGFPGNEQSAARESLRQLKARRDLIASRFIIADADEAPLIPLRNPVADQVEWRVVGENGDMIDGRSPIVTVANAGAVRLPALASGCYQLMLRVAAQHTESTIISAPRRCWRPEEKRKRWGLTAPAYGLVSADNLGIGDFSDIGAMAEAAAKRSASFLGLSPLHALFSFDRSWISPYSPSSRLFLDAIYIDPTKIKGFEVLARQLLAEAGRSSRLEKIRSGGLVSYADVWAVKRSILEAVWDVFRERGPSPEFEDFRREHGEALEHHALFEALAEAQNGGSRGRSGFNGLNARSDDTAAFKAANPELTAFHLWLQWLADDQLAAAGNRAKSAGMDLGLFTDLAVGTSPAGSEVWASPTAFLTDTSIGVPPDLLAPNGQNWGLRALSPLAMEDDGMGRYRALIAANMRHAAGIRIDHAFQLRRLFLIPPGLPASHGAYLTYPMDAMLAVLRLESNRAQCVVIGEDLGTAPENFSETIRSSGIFGYRVLFFERDAAREFVAPGAYADMVLAVINTHDLATLQGWWHGQDIKDRVKYDIIDNDEADLASRERDADRKRLVALLLSERILNSPEIPERAPTAAVARLLAKSRSELVSLQLDDVAAALQPQNMPGVTAGAPNWRRRLPMTIDELTQTDGPLDTLADAMAAEGRGPASSVGPDGN